MRILPSTLAIAFLAITAAVTAQQKPNLDKDPTLYVVGYAHLDTEWRWSYPTTIREYLHNTLQDNFKLFEKYPNYTFNFTGSNRYRLMKEYFPEDYVRLKEYVAQGRWFPGGSSIEEGDVNSPSLESIIRQVLYGNRYFKQEFGKESSEYMLPDCFGFPAALPSILAHCGIKGFSTQKLTWHSIAGIPFNLGVWEGPDGRSVVAALNPDSYGSSIHEDLSLNPAWLKRVQTDGAKSGVFADYRYYGTGDMGGSPDEESVKWMETSLAGKGPLKIMAGRSDQMFNDLTPEQISRLPRYKGDLELTGHSEGSASSEAMMKRWNHENEKLAQAAEAASVAGTLLGNETYPSEKLRDAWTLFLGGQFHDLLAGTALPKAYEYCWNDEQIAMNRFANVLQAGVGSVARNLDTNTKGIPLVVFNPTSFDRKDPVEAMVTFNGQAPTAVEVSGPDGRSVRAKVISRNGSQARILFSPDTKGLGFAVYGIQPLPLLRGMRSGVQATNRVLENANLRVTVNAAGDVSSIFDKRTNRETLSAPIRLAFMHENPQSWPAWAMDWADQNKPPAAYLGGKAKITIVENGPVRVALQIEREAFGSKFVQQVRLSEGGERVEFLDKIDWRTPETALKATFPLVASNPMATYNWQVGTIQRGNNDPKKYEVDAHRWFDLTDTSGKFGASILSQDKIGSDKPDDHTLRLTLIYTPGIQGGYQDQGSQDWGHHEILYGFAPHQGGWQTTTPREATCLDQPLIAFQPTRHAGTLGQSLQLFSVNTPNVSIVSVKKAEDSDGIIVRLRESDGKAASGTLVCSLPTAPTSVSEVDGQERTIGQAALNSNSLNYELSPYAVKAYEFSFAPSNQHLTDSVPVALPYNLDVISSRANRSDGDFDGQGRTLPADQLGDRIEVEGVSFQVGPKTDGAKNALACNGQTVNLPAGGQRVYLLAASSTPDHKASFAIGDKKASASIANWGGKIGQWDNRVWQGVVPDVAYDFNNKLMGIDPGFIKTDSIAWACSHRHAPAGDEVYEYSYLFKYGFDIPAGAKSITLPKDRSIKVLAISVVRDPIDNVQPATQLIDHLDGKVDAPKILVPANPSGNSILVTVKPGRYGNENNIKLTLNGKSQSYKGPFWLNKTATITAKVGEDGPPTTLVAKVDDHVAPYLTNVAAWKVVSKIALSFSEPIDRASAEKLSNYSSKSVKITTAKLSPDAMSLELALASPPQGSIALSIKGIKDCSPRANVMKPQLLVFQPADASLKLESFDANGVGLIQDKANVPTAANAPWTINFYVYMDKEPKPLTPILGFGNSSDNSRDGSSRYICQFDAGIHFWGRNVDIDAGERFDLGKWQMITATYDGQKLALYKNGRQLVSTPIGLTEAIPSFRIAPLDGWEGKRRFEGKVRDVTIWSSALDAVAVKAIYKPN